MESLLVKGTEFTPTISFDLESSVFEMSGISRPEDVMGFYQQVIDWLKQFDEEFMSHASQKYEAEKITLDIKMTYFNSSSAKSIMQILERFKKLSDKGLLIDVNFYYEDGDDQMLEDGEDLSEAIELPFNYIAVE